MGYCNQTDVFMLLANSMTTATNPTTNVPGDLLTIGKAMAANVISTDIVNQYISWADDQINGILSNLYVTPLSEKADFEANLLANIDEYNSYVILDRSSALDIGDTIILFEDGVQERHIIADIIATDTFSTVDEIVYYFTTAARVLRVKYPDPIPLVSARLATANIFEKYFAAQASPNQSEYGKFLRKLARQEINNLLNGRVVLHGETAISNRWVNPNIKQRIHLPKSDIDPQSNIDDVG
jgi:hypothetical protein